MNISPLTIYLWQLADRLVPPFATISVLLGVVSLVLFIVHMGSSSDAAKYAAKNKKSNNDGWLVEMQESEVQRDSSMRFLKKTLCGFLFSLAVSVLAPSSNTIAMMVIIPEIAHSKVVQQDLPDIYNAAVKALKDQLTK